MLNDYPDIRALTDKEPTWYDSNGVPRYAPIDPELAPNIYSQEVVFYVIQCQCCHKHFLVENDYSDMDKIVYRFSSPLSQDILTLHYGDPPRHDCCGAGETMNCEDIRVIEFWAKNKQFEWERRPELEVTLPEDGIE